MEAATLSSVDGDGVLDEDLFKEPPPRDECPICFLPRPIDDAESQYQACCGKIVCCGCICAAVKADSRGLCPFCRDPMGISSEEYIEKMKERVAAGDAEAIYNLGGYYDRGRYGLRRNTAKALKLYLRAGELGYAAGYNKSGYVYYTGQGVERDAKKGQYFWELAAMGGNVYARHNLGCLEDEAGNTNRAIKHFMIATAAGFDDSLKDIRICFKHGNVTKEDFEKALRAHKQSKDEMKSDQRREAYAAAMQEGRLSAGSL